MVKILQHPFKMIKNMSKNIISNKLLIKKDLKISEIQDSIAIEFDIRT
jgi:hypothetical protein